MFSNCIPAKSIKVDLSKTTNKCKLKAFQKMVLVYFFNSLFLFHPADSVLWKLFYVTGCIFVALQNMEEWEVRDT